MKPIPIQFGINDRSVGGRLGQQHGRLENNAAARQSSGRGLDMEGANGEPESGQACQSGILTYPNTSIILLDNYPYDLIRSAICLCS